MAWLDLQKDFMGSQSLGPTVNVRDGQADIIHILS